MADLTPDIDEILSQMRESFLETAHEKIDRLYEILKEIPLHQDDDALFVEFKREVHSLKGMGGTFQMPILTRLCHKFEEYLQNNEPKDKNNCESCLLYVDRIADYIEQPTGDRSESEWVANLPDQADNSLSKDDGQIDILLIADDEMIIREITRVTHDIGLSVKSVKNSMNVLQSIYTERPQIVLCAQVLKDMDGAEILRAIGAMHSASKTRLAMICPDRKKALDENLKGVTLLSLKKLEADIMNFIAITVSV